jgi:DNA-binding transcriptional LysR family regulator
MSRQFDDLSLGSLELFCLTAELESFTEAATAAGLTPPAVSRTIARLEARLGIQLFARTTRHVRLTESGRTYFEQCKQAIGQIVEAERLLMGEQTLPTGVLKMSLPTSYGHYRVLPLIPEFRQLYPGIKLELQLSNRNVDIAGEGYDLAIRGRTPPDSSLVARKLEDADLVVVATHSYLKRQGTPLELGDLVRHHCIHFALPSTGQQVPWLFMQKGRMIERSPAGAMLCFDDINGPVTLARHGGGLVQTYRYMVEDELRKGKLIEVLKDHGGCSRPFSLLFPANRHMPRRLRVLIDFLLERLGTS